MHPETYITMKQLCARLGVSRASINRWRAGEDFPKPRQFSKACVRWRLSDVIEWEQSRPVGFAFCLSD